MPDAVNDIVRKNLVKVEYSPRAILPAHDPNHPVIGHYFTNAGMIYYCDAYDLINGYWMTPAREDNWFRSARINVSENAIGHDFHRIGVEERAFQIEAQVLNQPSICNEALCVLGA